jgi:hypothetical protein
MKIDKEGKPFFKIDTGAGLNKSGVRIKLIVSAIVIGMKSA